MRNRYRHHRKHRTNNPSPTPMASTSSVQTAVTTDSSATTYDLQKTAIITAVLLVGLLGLYMTNLKMHWTLGFGAHLYQFLHIR